MRCLIHLQVKKYKGDELNSSIFSDNCFPILVSGKRKLAKGKRRRKEGKRKRKGSNFHKIQLPVESHWNKTESDDWMSSHNVTVSSQQP